MEQGRWVWSSRDDLVSRYGPVRLLWSGCFGVLGRFGPGVRGGIEGEVRSGRLAGSGVLWVVGSVGFGRLWSVRVRIVGSVG